MYTAPFGTHIETVCLDHNLRRESHHQAQVLAYPGFQVLASGGDGPAGWTNGCFDLNHSQLIVRLACSNAGGCAEGLNAHAYVRNIVIALADDADPSITAFGGDMTASGWLRGSKTLTADAADWGSGVYQLVGYVNGVEIGRVNGRCDTGGLGWNFAPRLAPCDGSIESLSLRVETASSPFVGGSNIVTAYVADYGGNVATRRATVYVDNENRAQRSPTSSTRRTRTSLKRRSLMRTPVSFGRRSTTGRSVQTAGCHWTPVSRSSARAGTCGLVCGATR